MAPTKDEIKAWLKKFGHSREWLGQKCGGVEKRTVDNWLSSPKEIPPGSLSLIERLMDDDERAEQERKKISSDIPLQNLVIEMTPEEFDAMEAAARDKGGVRAWALEALIRAAIEDEDAPNIVPMVSSKAHINAAAGSPIAADVLEWDGEDDTVRVKINGLSMIPMLNDGDIVEMKHKRASRSPYMKKGLIYLVGYDGGYTVKRYNSRKALPDEIGQEWVEMGKVKILQSLNPDFPEIIIKQEVEWFAWLPEK